MNHVRKRRRLGSGLPSGFFKYCGSFFLADILSSREVPQWPLNVQVEQVVGRLVELIVGKWESD